jgi:hypothetical protein
VKAGARLHESSYTQDVSWRPQPFTGTARVARVLAEFAAGATIVLQGLHLNRLEVARWCRALEARLGHPVQANAYWTPRDSQGLPVHHDTHDVFVLQVDGSKRWLVYEPVLELPLRDQRYSPALGEPGEAVLDVTLGPGDTLYLPRGWLHEALTSDEDSLHLTVGVNVRTWVDALRLALAETEENVELRRGVEPHGDGASEALERLAEQFDAESAAAAIRRRFVSSRPPILDGQLAQLRALERLRPETPVERRETVIADFDGRELAFEGKTLRFPPHAAEEVEALVTVIGPVRPAELPGRLDEPGRLVLVRRLVREGFLRISGVWCGVGEPRVSSETSRDAALGRRRSEPLARARDVEAGAARRLRLAGQKGLGAELELHLHAVGDARDLGGEVDRPAPVADALPRLEPEVVEAEEPGLLPHPPFRRLHRERVTGAAAVAGERDPPRPVVAVHLGGALGVEPAEVEALRQADDVAGEAVAADVARLPHPLRVGIPVQLRAQLAPEAGAARVALAVGADEHERVRERLPGRGRVAPERGRHVEGEQVAVRVEHERVEPRTPLPRRAVDEAHAALPPERGGADEHEPRVAQRRELRAEMLADAADEDGGVERVVRPVPRVLDEQPVLDPARSGRQRLLRAGGGDRARQARPARRRRRHSPCTTQMT